MRARRTDQRRRPGRRSAALVVCSLVVVSACADGSGPSGSEAAPTTALVTTTAAPVEGSTTTAPSTSAEPSTSSGGSPGSTTSSEPAAPTSSTAAPLSAGDRCLAATSNHVLAAQVVWPAVSAAQLANGSAITRWGVGGVILMDWPAGTPLDALHRFEATSRVPILTATDEEGGVVQRFRALERIPSEQQVAATMSPAEAEAMMSRHAALLAGIGIDIVFAPVVDVAPAVGTGPMGSRTFSSDPAVVTRYARRYVRAWRSNGILPTFKHFPGHGSASGDTHEGAAVTPPLAELWDRDLVPYRELVSSGAAVMVGHLDVPGLTDGVPASLSRRAVAGLLRHDLGYGGRLVVSDALGMGAISQDVDLPEAAVRTLRAGVDVALLTDTPRTPEVIDAVASAVRSGRLSRQRLESAARRVLRTKGLDGCALRRDG